MSLATLKGKAGQLIEKAEWEEFWYEQSGKWTTSFSTLLNQSTTKKAPKLAYENATNMSYFLVGNNVIESIDYYINCGKAINLASVINSCGNLKFIYGINASNASNLNHALARNPLLETIQEPLDFSKSTNSTNCFLNDISLKNIRFVPETIKISLSFANCTVLTAESIQSIIDGLATVETAQTLTLYANIKILQSQVDTANAKGWTVAGGTIVSGEEYYG